MSILFDLICFMKGNYFSTKHLNVELKRQDLSDTIHRVGVQITIIAGNMT